MNRLVAVLTATAAAAFAFAPSADAAVSCEYENSGILSVSMSADNDVSMVQTLPTGEILVRAQGPIVTCTGTAPTVRNTDSILIVDNSDNPNTPAPGDGNTRFSIIDPSSFAPGRTQEQGSDAFSEIEFVMNLNDGDDRLYLGGSTGADNWVLGRNQMNFNAGSGDPAPDSEMLTSPLDNILVSSGGGNDVVSAQGGQGTGEPFAGPGRLEINGDDGNDTLEGGSGTLGDRLDGGVDGNDTLSGFEGGDRLIGGPGDDVLRGGKGEDTIDYAASPAAVTVDLGKTGPQATGWGTDTVSEVDNVVGSAHADTLTGNSGVNGLDGGVGDDTLDGRDGADTLIGSGGVDTISYAQAPAGVIVDLTAGTAAGGAGDDRPVEGENLIGSAFADTLTGNAEANAITGGAGIDIVRALGGADTVDVRDGGADSASCGTELDTAVADQASVDSVDADCETTSFLPETPAPAPGGGDAPGGGTPTPAADRFLSFSLTGARSQRVLKQRFVRVSVRCPLEACTTVARGTGRSVRKLTLAPLTTRLGTGAARTLKLRLTAKQLAAVRKALRTGKRAKVQVSVRAVDAAGNVVTRTLTVAVKR